MNEVKNEIKGTVEAMAGALESLTVEDFNEENDNEEAQRLLDPLDVELKVNLKGDIQEITIVLGTGGPHFQIRTIMGNFIVEGWTWNFEGRTSRVVENKEVFNYVWDYYSDIFESR